jgi:pyruvate,water dikinase
VRAHEATVASPTQERSIYHCDDGTEFPVEWPNAEWPKFSWTWNDSHLPLPLTPLFAAISDLDEGRIRAYAEAGLIAPPQFRGFLVANGFEYLRMTPPAPEEAAQIAAAARKLAARYARPADVWTAYSRPRVQAACEAIRSAPLSTPVEELGNLYQFVMHTTHVAGSTLMAFAMALRMRLAAELGAEADLLIQEIGQGGANDTIESDQAIWRLAQLASRGDAAAALARSEGEGFAALGSLPEAHPFRAGVGAYLEEYGHQAEGWDPITPTLRERPERLMEMIRASLRSGTSPEARQAATAERRRQALDRVTEVFAGRPDALAQVEETAKALDGYVGVREGRARWQLVGSGSLRTALLKRGEALLASGVVGMPEDVFFLLPAEVDAAIGQQPGGGLRSNVAERRATWEFWKTKRPPAVVGAELTGPAVGIPAAIASTGPVLKGSPGSRGTVTAPVRVLSSLTEADSFQPGEVLVCAMTSPPWTPLFTLAAAVVTESGGALSHPAITAREYGIPCVLGAKDATRKLRTGELVTVDGAAGTVTRSL